MAIKTLILGNSGTGKSASLRNFNDEEIAVINCAGKPLPFKNRFETYIPRFEMLTDDVIQAMDKTEKKVIVIDDFQYILSFPWLRRIKEKGWEKFEDIQSDYFNIIQACDYMPDNVTVYFMSHTTTDENGNEKIKTIGKMLDERISIEGLFSICLKTNVTDGKYYFLTQNSGRDTVKSPIGMFDSYAIDNDLKYVDTKIRNYYEIGDYVSDEEVKAMDENAAAPEVEKPDETKTKRRRGRPKKEVIKNDEIKEEKKQEPIADEAEKADEEKPKRRRKRRENVAGTAENVAGTAENVADEEKPKRRRRKREEKYPAEITPEDVTAATHEISDDDLPF